MTSILQQLQPWLDSWLPPFLLGGLKHRDAREAHELLHHDIFQASQTHRKFFGAKLDIRKCFGKLLPKLLVYCGSSIPSLLDVLSLKKFVQLRNSLVLQASYRDVRRRLLCWLVS